MSEQPVDVLEKEARLFTRYLIGKDADSHSIELYKSAMSTSRPESADQKLLGFMASHPRSIGLIDAGLVFHNPSSEARRRLYIMFAILEASPSYYDLFLPKKRSPIYLLVILYCGIRAVVKAILGIPLVKVVT